jgi:hypothetical protein
MHCDQIECMGLFLFSYICCGLLCALRYDPFWRRSHGLLRRMYIVQKLDEIFCKLPAMAIWSMVWFRYRISLLIFVWMTFLLVIGGYIFGSFRVCLMKLGALTLGAYRLITVISFWCISPFISMECLSLSRLINVGLKSTLSEISIATPACF